MGPDERTDRGHVHVAAGLRGRRGGARQAGPVLCLQAQQVDICRFLSVCQSVCLSVCLSVN